MEQILIRTADTLQYQLQKGWFEPEGFEYSFGPGGEADPITFPLTDGRWLKLVGQIDRLDLCRQDDAIFVKVLDYKSGSNDLKEDLMKRGLQLQLLMYMNAVINNLSDSNPDKEIIPAAMLYYKITDAVLDGGSAAGETGDSDEPSDQTLAEIRAALRPTGLVNDDPSAYKLLDTGIAGKSDVIPLSIKKDGSISGKSPHVFSTEGFKALSREVTDVVCKLAEGILDGNAAAEPAVWDKDKEACTYCPYKEVCGFDLSIDGYRYRDH
jgi:ATP-dependent helicase/nuclease subunit B